MQRLFSCGLAMLILAGSAAAALAQERFALLIGNSRYEVATPLRNPENDIEMMAAALEKSGFSTRKAANLDHAATLAAVDGFIKDVEAAENPVVMVYFAGHGVQLDGENYLLPVDVKIGSEDEIRAYSLALGQLSARLDALDSRLQIIVLDSCRDNPFEGQTRGLRRGLAETPEKLGKLVAFSTSPGNVASDGDTGASPYAAALAESVTIPGLALEEVFKRVRATVKERTGGKQEPWENSAVYGDFHFMEKKQDTNQGDEVAFFEFAALADSQEAYQKYLSRFPDGMFASLARQKIEFMDKDFSFRRQNETFRMFQLGNPVSKPCGDAILKNAAKADDRILQDKEIILFDAYFEYPDTQCPGDFSYFDTTTDNESGEYALNRVSLNYFGRFFREAGNVALDKEHMRSAFEGYEKSVFGYRGYNGGDRNAEFVLKVLTPPVNALSYVTVDACEGTCFYVRALAQVHATHAEETVYYDLNVVSAAELGLSWKYQNTLTRAEELRKEEVANLYKEFPVEVAAAGEGGKAAEAYRTSRMVSGWDVAAVFSDTNSFRNCRAFRPHRGNMLSFFRKYPDGRLSVGHFDPAFNMGDDLALTAPFSIDGALRNVVPGKAYSKQEIAYDLGNAPEISAAVKAGRELLLGDERITLSGSKAMLAELETCVSAFAAESGQAEQLVQE